MEYVQTNSDVATPIPNELTPAQIEAVADANGKAVSREVRKTVWKLRAHGTWAGGALGLFFGAVIGSLAVLSTALVGVPMAAIGAMILPVAGVFSIYGIITGSLALNTVDLTAGAIVGGQKVSDRKKLMRDPSREMADTLRYRGTVKEKETFWNKVIPFTRGSENIFNLRNFLIFSTLGLAVGALMVTVGGPLGALGVVQAISHIATPIIAQHVTAGAVAATALTAKAMSCMCVATFGLFGALFGLDFSTITANATEFVGDIFSGKVFHGKSREPVIEQAISPGIITARSAQGNGPVVFRNTTSVLSTPIGSYAGKPASQHVRMLAEQEFKNMKQPSQGNAMN